MSGQPQAPQEARKVLVKLRGYDGSESVLRRHSDPELAQLQADAYNQAFQTDTCYVEDYDPAKDEWPKGPRGREEALAYLETLMANKAKREQEAAK